MSFWTLFTRACRLRCPYCGVGRLFRNWLRMNERCETCGLVYDREGGFFLGSIYFNYGLTTLIVAIAYPVLLFTGSVAKGPLLYGSLAFVLLFPLWFFRYARSLWLGFDQYCDPRQPASSSAESAKQ